ncbi:MAG TPA: hypothetical protein VFA18_08995 [Gemmataceae bacterium]|nr:hypothetical protein [Gemmataceae bacterium]
MVLPQSIAPSAGPASQPAPAPDPSAGAGTSDPTTSVVSALGGLVGLDGPTADAVSQVVNQAAEQGKEALSSLAGKLYDSVKGQVTAQLGSAVSYLWQSGALLPPGSASSWARSTG